MISVHRRLFHSGRIIGRRAVCVDTGESVDLLEGSAVSGEVGNLR
jgi:hypothetical protein